MLCGKCKGQVDTVSPCVHLDPNHLKPTVQIEIVSCPACKIIWEINILGDYTIGTSIFVDTRKGQIRRAA